MQLESSPARPYARVKTETTQGQRELTHLQVYTELGVGRGAEVCVCE